MAIYRVYDPISTLTFQTFSDVDKALDTFSDLLLILPAENVAMELRQPVGVL